MDLSLVIPVFNEEESVEPLLAQIHGALDPTGLNYEVICVDDGSRDSTARRLEQMTLTDPRLKVVVFRRNFGQTAAMQAGLDFAQGDNVALMDGDLQNDPADIPRMLKELDQGYDMIAGWRKDRKDTFINRRLPSMIANALISRVTKVRLHDYGCSLKVMRREIAKELRLYGEMHRFIPALASFVGARIKEMPVNHRARAFGKTKYGIGRTTRVILDLCVVRFMQSYQVRPMQIFGLGGMISGALGVLLCLWLTLQKLIWNEQLADRPALLLGVLLILVGVKLVSFGLLGDLMCRTYHEAQGKRSYAVRRFVANKACTAAPAVAPISLIPPSSSLALLGQQADDPEDDTMGAIEMLKAGNTLNIKPPTLEQPVRLPTVIYDPDAYDNQKSNTPNQNA